MAKAVRHIAAIRLSALGDVALTVPVLLAFTRQYPEIGLTIVSRPFFRPLFDNIPNLEFFVFDERGRHKGLVGLIRLYSDLKKNNIYAFADLHDVLRSKILRTIFKIGGSKVASINKGREEKKALTRRHHKDFRQLKHVTQRYADVFEKLGFPIDMSQQRTLPKHISDSNSAAIVGKKVGKWLGIAPYAKHQAKVYPSELMRKVIDALSQDKDLRIFLFGSPVEIPALKALAGNENIFIVPEKLKFDQELVMISNLDLMLSMDSGNAHLAAIFGVPTVTLWGATHPFAGFSPFNQPMENALVSDRDQYPMLPTSVYGNKIVAGYEDVMRTIDPETVISKVRSLLGPGHTSS